jgi:hypothetical protein
MIYILFPHDSKNFRIFTNYTAAEQAILRSAKGFEREGHDPDWCILIAYEGIDELYPVFVYNLVGSNYLVREEVPSPSP